MSILSWNYRGLKNPQIIRVLCQLVKEKYPDMVFLMETKLQSAPLEVSNRSWVLIMFLLLTVEERVGVCLALFWKADFKSAFKNLVDGI
jgi:exonuclease III